MHGWNVSMSCEIEEIERWIRVRVKTTMKNCGELLMDRPFSHGSRMGGGSCRIIISNIHMGASTILARLTSSQGTGHPPICHDKQETVAFELAKQAAPPRDEVLALASVLKHCSEAKDLARGKLVHTHISNRRYDHNVFLGNWLVQMYGECGHMDEAQAVFDSLPGRNLYSWTILMRAYARNGRPREALDCFSRMQIHGIKADSHTFVAALEACASLGALEQGQLIHAAIVDSCCEGEIIVATALVNMYGKCGGVQHARRVFSQMLERNVVTWNAMISAFSQNGYAQQALDLFLQMQYDGFTPDHITLICIVDACGDLAALDKGQQIHAAIIERGYEGHLVVGNALVNMYGKCQSLHNAQGVFRRMHKHNVVSWNTMISVYAQNGHGIEALKIFYSMDSDGVRPNQVTFLCALDACARMVNLHEGQKIHAAIVKSKYEGQLAVGNALINMYGKCNSLQNSLNVFNQMPRHNVISWNTIISACTQNSCCKEALDYYDLMQNTSLKPNEITFLGALDACTKLAALEKGQEIHGTIIDGGYEGLTMVGNALINMYGQCRALQDARSVFGRMRHQDVISWNAMIAACTWNGQGKEALNYFYEMQRYDVKPNEITFVCALDACAILAILDKGQEIHAAIVDRGFEGQIIVGTALLNMYGKCGSLQKASEVFAQLPKRDIVCWNAMIITCAQNGHDKEALDVFQRMLSNGIKPNEATFLGVLTACSHAGRVNDGRQFFFSMSQEHDIRYTVEHYKCLIDILGRAGLLEEAEDLIKTMPYQSEASVWLCLLAACRLHGDVERGVRAASHIFKLDPGNGAPHVLLSNAYAVAGRNDNAELL